MIVMTGLRIITHVSGALINMDEAIDTTSQFLSDKLGEYIDPKAIVPKSNPHTKEVYNAEHETTEIGYLVTVKMGMIASMELDALLGNAHEGLATIHITNNPRVAGHLKNAYVHSWESPEGMLVFYMEQ